jgi:hypothetical protein
VTAETVQPLIEPDAAQMFCHLEHLFGGYLDGCHEGKVELAWTDGRDRKLRHAAIFGTDEIDVLVERAVQANRIPGQNVYIGQALRKPDIPPFGRCTDADFFALTACYVDLDDDVLSAARERYRQAGCPPTAVVVTGRHPHTRAQMLWRQEIPERDADLCRQQNLAIAQALGGDTTVVNPSRVLRLGGSIAWPAKPGRVLERTEFHLFDDGRPKLYVDGQLARAFPPKPAVSARPVEVAAEPIQPAATPRPDLKIGSEFDGVSVEACLAAVRAGDHWHDNLVRLTGHWIARGWSDEEILIAAESLTLTGYTIDQTRREVAQMIAGGRTKWNIPNPQHAVEEVTQVEIRIADWTADRYAGEAKPLQWLCRGTIPLGLPGMLAAMGGLGKSFLALDLAVQIAAGVAGLEQPKAILGGRLAVDGAAVILTAEDSYDAIHRRLNRIDPENRRMRRPERLMVVPLADTGGPRPLIAGDGKNLLRTPFFAELKRQLVAIGDLRVVVIDPLQAFVLADVNSSPEAAQFLWSAMAEICAATGATLLLTHHMRKDGGFVINSVDDAREAVRGTTALVDGGRFTYALWKAAEEEARSVCTIAGHEFQPDARPSCASPRATASPSASSAPSRRTCCGCAASRPSRSYAWRCSISPSGTIPTG